MSSNIAPTTHTAQSAPQTSTANVSLDVSAQSAEGATKAPSNWATKAWEGVKKAWRWANQSPFRQFLIGVGAITVGATISAATGGALGVLGMPLILTGAYMVLRSVAKTAYVKEKLDKLYPKQQVAGAASADRVAAEQGEVSVRGKTNTVPNGTVPDYGLAY